MNTPYYIYIIVCIALLAACVLLTFLYVRLKRIHVDEVRELRTAYGDEIEALKAELAKALAALESASDVAGGVNASGDGGMSEGKSWEEYVRQAGPVRYEGAENVHVGDVAPVSEENNAVKIENVEIKTADEKLMQRITAVINANIKNSDLDISLICGEVGISRVHLHRKMKELTDQTPHEYVRNIRLRQAARLLTRKGQSVTDVVYNCGFGSVSSFSTMFKKMYGVSPREYAKQHEVREMEK